MKRCQSVLLGLILVLVATPGASHAAQSSPPAEPASPVLVDTKAVAAIKAMGAYLRTVQTFSVQAEISKDEVLESGQKLQFGSKASFQVQKPNYLRVDTESDHQTRQMYYDGKTFTLFSPILKYYAQVPAPGTIGELLTVADEKFAIEIPLADLFYWGIDTPDQQPFIEASVIGPARIGSTLCDHYAFRQEGVDWQIWIEQGEKPLPRKLVITTTTEDSQPQYIAQYTWDLQPSFEASAFQFVPPGDSHAITMIEVDAKNAPAQ